MAAVTLLDVLCPPISISQKIIIHFTSFMTSRNRFRWNVENSTQNIRVCTDIFFRAYRENKISHWLGRFLLREQTPFSIRPTAGRWRHEIRPLCCSTATTISSWETGIDDAVVIIITIVIEARLPLDQRQAGVDVGVTAPAKTGGARRRFHELRDKSAEPLELLALC